MSTDESAVNHSRDYADGLTARVNRCCKLFEAHLRGGVKLAADESDTATRLQRLTEEFLLGVGAAPDENHPDGKHMLAELGIVGGALGLAHDSLDRFLLLQNKSCMN